MEDLVTVDSPPVLQEQEQLLLFNDPSIGHDVPETDYFGTATFIPLADALARCQTCPIFRAGGICGRVKIHYGPGWVEDPETGAEDYVEDITEPASIHRIEKCPVGRELPKGGGNGD